MSFNVIVEAQRRFELVREELLTTEHQLVNVLGLELFSEIFFGLSRLTLGLEEEVGSRRF